MGTRIVVVDDTPGGLEFYQRVLTGIEDAELAFFASPSQALAACLADPPDLTIVSHETTLMNGLEFVEALRERHPADAAAVMIAVSSDKRVLYRALELEIDEVCTKPIDEIELVARARNVLKARERRLEAAALTARLTHQLEVATAATLRRERSLIDLLMQITDFRDNETRNHVVRIGHFSRVLARSIGLPEYQQERIGLAAPLHDIGKVGVPDHILLKRGKLTPEEFNTMRTHARIGYDILNGHDSPTLQIAADIALSHHEKYNGTGYPYGLAGKDIPIAARICAVTDVFDALLSERSYKDAWPLAAAVEELERGRGTHFDPDLIDAFLDVIPEFEGVSPDS